MNYQNHEFPDPYLWAGSTIRSILRKEEYLGHTVNFKTYKDSYKDKRRKKTPPDERVIFENTHPAIVDEETWQLVQRLIQTVRKPNKYGTINPLTGVLYCADCGAKMYHKQGTSDPAHRPHHEYVCSSYRHYSRSCTCHYIRVEVIENLILETIRNVSGYVRKNETEFMKRVIKTSAIQQEETIKESKKKYTQAKRRREEISGLIKKLYESYAADKIPEKHFTELLAGYDAEQTMLDREIDKREAALDNYNSDSVRADKFIELVKRHTEFTEFSAALLNEFIEKVIVHEAVKIDGVRTMQVDIYLNFIGKFELPESAQPKKEIPKRTSTKKLRRDMTEEELQKVRELDHKRYAKKRDARIFNEQSERAAILQGTSFETLNSKSEIKSVAS